MTAARPPVKPLRGDTLRSVVTPEGIDLRLRIGDAGERAAAFLIDALIVIAMLAGLSIVAALAMAASKGQGWHVYAVIWLLGFFILRNVYFVAFELGGRAATPGKRVMGLRVAARSGGPLTEEAVFARNAMREIEVFLPASVLFANGADNNGWIVLFGAVWSGVFLLFPLFNRDRLRVGDLIAGTWVVKSPKVRLLPDLAASSSRLFRMPMEFSPAQLQAYGIMELHVLEDVLRVREPRTVAAVAARIRRKIDWAAAPYERDADFLAAYYAALRGRLEHRLLFGHRRADKFDRA